MPLSPGKTALLHYWMTNMRGGENVLAEIAGIVPLEAQSAAPPPLLPLASAEPWTRSCPARPVFYSTILKQILWQKRFWSLKNLP